MKKYSENEREAIASKEKNSHSKKLPSSPVYKTQGRQVGVAAGGVPAIKTMLDTLGFSEVINSELRLFKIWQPYSEADHVLSMGLNPLFGGRTLDDIKDRRTDEAMLTALGTAALPAPTTAGDFCRRFSEKDITTLMDSVNEVRLKVWKKQEPEFFDIARIDVDGVIVETGAECAEGVDYSYKGIWGYHPLIVSLANTQEPLYIVNRKGSRPSHEGASDWLDKSALLCIGGGFKTVRFRGDTDFSQTKYLDKWDRKGYEFVFGIDAMPNLKAIASEVEESLWEPCLRESQPVDEEDERQGQVRHKREVIAQREFNHFELSEEHITEVNYKPGACEKAYRLVILRKLIHVHKGERMLFPETRYHFYISNVKNCTAREIVKEANDRCNQENLNSHLKVGVHALRAPLKTLDSNWAYMVMTSLAWSFKAWFSLLAPVRKETEFQDRAIRKRLLTMEFRTFLNNLMMIPCLVIRTCRQVHLRLLTSTKWSAHFLRISQSLRE